MKASRQSASLLLLTATLMGCGGSDGPQRYEISGAVTHAGKTIPVGEVIFEPSEGPGAVAPIKYGRYETVDGQGVVGGPHTVRIMGFDGVAVGDSSSGTPLFAKPYQTSVDLPKEDGVKDFDVPASHK